MPEVSSNLLDELCRRLARLEAATSRPRRVLNQREAAEYLGRSAEWLRIQHLAGRGPRRRQRGRFWDYDVSDLEVYRENGDG